MLKAAIIQTNTSDNIIEGFCELEALIRRAANQGANLIVTPEGSNILERDLEKFKLNAPFWGEDLGYSKLAKELEVYLYIGSALFQIPDNKGVNRALLYSPDGNLISYYDKIHLFDVNLGNGKEYKESNNYQNGETAIIAKTPFGNIGFAICYDVRFPHLFRNLAQNGAQIICIPAAFTVATGKAHWEILLRARAIETGSFIIAPAQGGIHKDGRITYGHSMIINPWGEIIAHIDSDKPDMALALIDINECHEARQKIPAWSLNTDFNLKIIE